MKNNNILVIQNRPGVGDMCIFIPFIHAIKKKYKDCDIYILTKRRSSAKDLLKYDLNIKEVFYIPENKNFFEKLNFYKNLKNKFFSSVYIYHYGVKFYFLSMFLKIKKINFYGFRKKNTNIFTQAKISTGRWLNQKNIEIKPKLFLKNAIQKENLISIGIGGSGKNKKWDIENYINLIKKILEVKKVNFIIAGGPEELEDFNKIFDQLKKLNIKIISTCNLSIHDSMYSLAKSKLYIGNDTGFMHICGSFEVRSFGLFGDTPPNYVEYNDFITPILPKNNKEIGHDSFSMNLITVEHVFETIFKYI